MTTPQVVKTADALRRLAREHPTLEAARDAYIAEMEVILGDALSAGQNANLQTAFDLVLREKSEGVEVLRSRSMYIERPSWYEGPRLTDRHWPAVEKYLINAKGWSENTVSKTIGEASTEIVSLLDDPSRAKFRSRGLVIGYVQSGKTANMIAVIAKAMDAGYNYVIILAGLTNKLRQQTQRRIEQDVAERYREYWQLLTNAEDKGDFQGLPNGRFFVPSAPSVALAVVKKNVAPLRRLIEAVGKTPPAELRRMKVLVIDDEADQASVNSASNEMNMTRINEQIRTLLAALPAVSYVGYTATPFANVFINPRGKNGDLDDLYPRDFITALQEPEGYFGTKQLFGVDPADPANPLPEEEGLDVIRTISSEDAALIQPKRRKDKDGFQPELPDSLRAALFYYLAACAARRARGHAAEHMTMLVHTSSFVVMHEKLAGLIEGWLHVSKGEILKPGSALNDDLRTAWDGELDVLPSGTTTEPRIEFGDLAPHLQAVFDAMEVRVENGTSTDRINYEDGPKTYIVVGGSVLARGLTLEGLMVSFFLRTSNQYDTLLQMGRWFGYRKGYEDLPRIWMSEDLEASFRALAAIEREIREDVSQYAQRKLSPMEFAVRVRSIPGMAITAAAKMRAAIECDISYSGAHVQTIQFDHLSETVAQKNWNAAVTLVSASQTLGCRTADEDRILFGGVPRNLIIQFLRNLHIETTRNDLRTEFLRGYINAQADLGEWNVGVVTTVKGATSILPLGGLGPVRTVQRSRMAKPAWPANIKALMSRQDVMFDCPGVPFDRTSKWTELKELRRSELGDVPLLLIYPIDRFSPPMSEGKRIALDACADQIGIGIVFPGSVTGAGGYYHVDLDPPSSEELDDMDAEINEMEAAGLD
jgi:hypothetical protein